jgi:hypothetical protein
MSLAAAVLNNADRSADWPCRGRQPAVALMQRTRAVLQRRRRATRKTQRRGTSDRRIVKNQEMPTRHYARIEAVS